MIECALQIINMLFGSSYLQKSAIEHNPLLVDEPDGGFNERLTSNPTTLTPSREKMAGSWLLQAQRNWRLR
jgi:hypothetical protein